MTANPQKEKGVLDCVRADFPLLRDKVYLNTASMQPVPRVVRKKIARDLAAMAGGDPNLVGEYPPSSRLRQHYARLMGCQVADVCFTMNVSDGLMKAVSGLNLKAGDRVLVGKREFPSLTYLARSLERQGIEVRWIEGRESCPDDLTEQDLIEAADGCALVLFSWVHYLTGRRLNLSTLSCRLKEKGVRAVVVDGMQGLGPCFPDLKNTQVDAFAFNSVKWIGGPAGAGGLYLNQGLQKNLQGHLSGWFASQRTDFKNSHRHDLEFWPDARQLETGSPPLLVHRAVEAYLDWFFELDQQWIMDRSQNLAEILFQRLTQAGFCPITPAQKQNRAAIITVPVENPEEVFSALYERGILLSLRNGLLRFSPYFFNTEEDLELAVAVLAGAGP